MKVRDVVERCRIVLRPREHEIDAGLGIEALSEPEMDTEGREADDCRKPDRTAE